MADVLDQSEVDALLSAVAEGTFDSGPVVAGSAAAAKDIHNYDFKRPERVSKDQMRALQTMHEMFSRNFGASLSAFLRTIVEVRVATAEQLTYSEFIHSLPSPTVFNLLGVPPLEGQMCLEISPLIVFPVIDRLLGGSSAELFIPQRPLTDLEQRLVRRITDKALATLTEVWSELVEIKFALHQTESNPHLVQIVAPNEVVVVIGFEIKMGPRGGTMSLCIPFNVIEPVMGKLVTQSWLAYTRRGHNTDMARRIETQIAKAEIALRAFLAKTSITCRDLLHLQPGDILTTDKPASSDFVLEVEGRPKYRGSLGQFRGNRALRINRPCGPEERY
ncbi:MAG: flagellar motor switch protein FliM [Phycisphaerae bacterium]